MTQKEERCLIRFDGSKAICRRIESDGKCQVRRKNDGGWRRKRR